jgi:hypothetical protein
MTSTQQQWSWMPQGLRSLCNRYEYLARHPPTRPAPWFAAQRPLPAARRHASHGLSSIELNLTLELGHKARLSEARAAREALVQEYGWPPPVALPPSSYPVHPLRITPDCASRCNGFGALSLHLSLASELGPPLTPMQSAILQLATRSFPPMDASAAIAAVAASACSRRATRTAATDQLCDVSQDLEALHLGAASASSTQTPCVSMMHETCVHMPGQDGGGTSARGCDFMELPPFMRNAYVAAALASRRATLDALASHATSTDPSCNVSLDLRALHSGAAPASSTHTPCVSTMHKTSLFTLDQDDHVVPVTTGSFGGYWGARQEAEEAAARVSARPVAPPAHTYVWPPPAVDWEYGPLPIHWYWYTRPDLAYPGAPALSDYRTFRNSKTGRAISEVRDGRAVGLCELTFPPSWPPKGLRHQRAKHGLPETVPRADDGAIDDNMSFHQDFALACATLYTWSHDGADFDFDSP